MYGDLSQLAFSIMDFTIVIYHGSLILVGQEVTLCCEDVLTDNTL